MVAYINTSEHFIDRNTSTVDKHLATNFFAYGSCSIELKKKMSFKLVFCACYFTLCDLRAHANPFFGERADRLTQIIFFTSKINTPKM